MRQLLLSVLACGALACAASSVAPTQPKAAPVLEPAASPPSCQHGTPAPSLGTATEHPSSGLVVRGTGMDAYRLESGVWLTGAPVLVNEDFDFTTAMALDSVGAGIAAAKRKENNRARAAELSNLTLPHGVSEELERLRDCGIHRWGLLWSGKDPAFQLITDRFDAEGKVVESKAASYPVDGMGNAEAWLAPANESALPLSSAQ